MATKLVRFADGPAGRRARLLGTGKDVSEVIAVVRDNGGDAAEAAFEVILARCPGDEALVDGEEWL